LVINKTDLLSDKSELFSIIEKYMSYFPFSEVIPLSAKTGDGINILKDVCLSFAKDSVHYFSDNDVTDQSEKVIVAEFIREKLLLLLDKEIPHGVAVDLERFYERDNKDGEAILEVEAVIYTEKDSHKGIIIGKGGAMLKKIGTLARKDIEKFYGTKASVKIWVKTKEDWRNRQSLIHTFGLD
jgi:GTP-binding protein Era